MIDTSEATCRRKPSTWIMSVAAILLVACASESDPGDAPDGDDDLRSTLAPDLTALEREAANADQSARARAPQGATGPDATRASSDQVAVDRGSVDLTPPTVNAPSNPRASAAQAPVQSGISLADVSALGTGCPKGAVEIERNADGSVAAVHFENYLARVEAGSSFSIRDCQLGLRVNNPGGLAYALQAVTYSGSAAVGAPAQSTLTSRVYQQGDAARGQEGTTKDFAGSAGDFTFTSEFADPSVWSGCGGSDLNLSTRLRIVGAGGSEIASLGVERIAGFKFVTRPCAAVDAPAADALADLPTEVPSELPAEGPSVISVERVPVDAGARGSSAPTVWTSPDAGASGPSVTSVVRTDDRASGSSGPTAIRTVH